MNIAEFKKVIFSYSRKINESMNIAFSFLGEKYGITLLQLRLLMEINHCGSHTIGSLADAVNMAGANISTMCKKLEKQGLVRRIRDQVDERVVRIELTDFGKKSMTEIDHYLNEKLNNILANQAEETFEMITAGMDKINSLLLKLGRDHEEVGK